MHRLRDVRRDFWRTPKSSPLLKAASVSLLLRVVCSWVLNTFKYIDFTTSADLLKQFVSLIYTFLLQGFRQQQDAAKAFWRVNKPKPSSLCLSQRITCSVLWFIWRARCWNHSDISMFILYWGAQNWTSGLISCCCSSFSVTLCCWQTSPWGIPHAISFA